MIRIIAGDYRRRTLATPKGQDVVRPLPDRVRTSIFNMLVGHLEGQPVFDAFAGVGSFGLEAASRGAQPVVMVERDREIGRLLEQNAQTVGAGERVQIVKGDALGLAALAQCPAPVHVAFFDPPYPMMEDAAQRGRIMAQFANVVERLDADGFAIIRSPWPFLVRDEEGVRTQEAIDLHVPGAEGPETHVYGSTAVHWYVRAKEH
ncbi:MAG: RsmD family RNA methyltransferase [Phycisphaerales bacterium]|nr:RsmD family RNA methyltransferase [Phycisphaerales bacterium]